MSNNSYFVEFAKSNRSKCKKCKETIQKDEIRIMVEIPGESFNTTQSYHPSCFTMPRKFITGPTKISALDFFSDHVHDKSDGQILPSKLDELVAQLESTAPKAGNPKNDNNENNAISRLKKEFQTTAESGTARPSKKAKKDASRDETFMKQVDLYGLYHKKYKNDEIKDILGYNRQTKTGTRDFLLMKLIDGSTYGRLARCELCGGRLKLKEDGNTVVCSGSFDDTINVRIECAFSSSAANAPRYQPWFMEEPTEEESAEMNQLEAEAKGEAPKISSNDENVSDILNEINNQRKGGSQLSIRWDLTNREGLRTATQDVLRILSSPSKKKGSKIVDLPNDHGVAMQKLGQIISSNRSKSLDEVLPLIIQEFGYKEDKENKVNKKKQMISNAVKNPENGSLVAAFQELAELYFKTGNANAGVSYTKVVKALSDVPYEITAENAKNLAKGKTKVANIGKSSADKIFEYCSTGTIAKLEEKRADAA